ncbi:MAG: glycosyltransferase [Pseudomonadota bacterium]
MILATTGTQLPFPRLIDALDALAATLDERIVAQIGPDTAPYSHIETHATLAPDRLDALMAEARIVVAHAGIGTILSARGHGRPLVVMPRRHALGEHRNDHQMATVRELGDRAGLYVAWEADDLAPLLAGVPLAGPPAPTDAPEGPRRDLIAHLKGLIETA